MKLRMKILSGFLILAVMLAIAGIFFIHELTSINTSVQNLVDENYKSIDAAKKMIEALEREDSGLLLRISGDSVRGQQMLQKADNAYLSALEAAKNNLSVPNEIDAIEYAELTYKSYKSLWSGPAGGNNDLDWYFDYGHPAFQLAKDSVNQLIALNEATLYQTASDLKNRMQRIIMPGIIAIVSALVFAIVFNFFITHYFINPLISITNAVQKSLKTGNPCNIEIETNDELKDLASAVSDLSGLIPKSR